MSACGPDVPPSRRPDDLDLSTPATRRRRVHDVESVLRCIFFKCVRAGPAATERDCREAPPDALAATWLRRQGNCVHNLSVSCLVFVRTVEGGVRAAAGKGAREGGVAAAAADGGARGTSGRGMTPASSLRRAGGSCGKEVRVFVRALRACVRARVRSGPPCRGDSGRHIHLRPPPHPPHPPHPPPPPLALRCHRRAASVRCPGRSPPRWQQRLQRRLRARPGIPGALLDRRARQQRQEQEQEQEKREEAEGGSSPRLERRRGAPEAERSV